MKYDDVVSVANNPNWLNDAKELMGKRKAFVVVGWQSKFDQRDSEALAKEFNYNFREDTDPNNPNRAYFEPRKSI